MADELANIFIYCLSLSNALDPDVSSAVLGKLQTNEHRYPADEAFDVGSTKCSGAAAAGQSGREMTGAGSERQSN